MRAGWVGSGRGGDWQAPPLVNTEQENLFLLFVHSQWLPPQACTEQQILLTSLEPDSVLLSPPVPDALPGTGPIPILQGTKQKHLPTFSPALQKTGPDSHPGCMTTASDLDVLR